MRDFFHTRLEEFKEDFIHMGSFVEDQYAMAVEALDKRNVTLSRTIIDREETVNQLYKELERQALELIIRYQPFAKDLQLIASILKIISDLERIGDNAEDIANLVILCDGRDFPDPEKEQLIEMGLWGKKMLAKGLDAFVMGNKSLAEDTFAMEDKMDRLYSEMIPAFFGSLHRSENQENEETVVYLIQIAKYFEKVGDHAENIAERVDPTEL